MSNFSTGPNTTATRFYNPKGHAQGGHSPNHMNETQSRFMQNMQNNRAKIVTGVGPHNGVFQNNFLLPKASPNAGMLKTFYNSK